MACLPFDSDVRYTLTTDGRFYHSMDGGQNIFLVFYQWFAVVNPLSSALRKRSGRSRAGTFTLLFVRFDRFIQRKCSSLQGK